MKYFDFKDILSYVLFSFDKGGWIYCMDSVSEFKSIFCLFLYENGIFFLLRGRVFGCRLDFIM